MLAMLAWELTGKTGTAPDLEAFCVATAGRFLAGTTQRIPAADTETDKKMSPGALLRAMERIFVPEPLHGGA